LPWLFDTSSLTARLAALVGKDFSVRVLSQQWQTLDTEEAAAMALTGVRSALVRQVLLCLWRYTVGVYQNRHPDNNRSRGATSLR